MIRRCLALAVPLMLVVAACGDGDGAADDGDADVTMSTTTTVLATSDASTTSAPAPPATSVPTSEPEPETEPPATTAASTVPPTTEPDAGDDCLVGAWVVSEAEMNRFYDAIEADIDGIEFDVSGQTLLSFGVDTYEYLPDFVLALSVSGIEGSGDTGGNITGSYEVVDGVITTSSEVNALTIAIEVGGQAIDGSAMGNDLLNSSPINAATFDCSGATPVIDFNTGSGSVPITLTPA